MGYIMRTMDLTPKQQTSEAIRQAESIVVMTGQHPSVDQVSAVIALSAILRKFGKKVSPVISDNLPQSVQMLEANGVEHNLGGLRDFILKLDVSKAEVDKLRYEVIDGKLNIYISPFKGGFAPSDVTFDYGQPNISYDLAIVLGVPTRTRIDRAYERNQALFEKIPVVNLDFHRSNENYGAVNLIEPNASSLCEMMVALAESLQGGIIEADIATALLMGIVASTDRFTASHTTSKSLTVAAQMMAAGARQQAVVRALYRDNRSGSDNQRSSSDRSSNQNRETARNEARPATEPKVDAPAAHVQKTADATPAPVPVFQPEDAPPKEVTQNADGAAETVLRNTAPAADFAAAAEILADRELRPQADIEQPE